MKREFLKYCIIFAFLLILSSAYSQQEIDTTFFETSLLEQSKGASKEEIKAFKKEINKVVIVSYKGMKSLIYSKPSGFKQSDFENRQTLKGGKKNKIIDLVYSDKVGGLQGVCYNPRNAIILYNPEDEVIGFIEVCFECITMKSESDIPKMSQLSDEGFTELKAVFEKYALIKSK